MILVRDNNNERNNAQFDNGEMVIACDYMNMLKHSYNCVGCSLTLLKDGKIETFFIN